MPRKRWIASAVGLCLAGYLAFWPVPIAPVAWSAPTDAGLTGAFAANRDLEAADLLPIAGHVGPEDAVLGPDGRLYVSTHSGVVLVLNAHGEDPAEFARTGGRPLGLAFHPGGDLIVADAYRGLLAIDPSGKVRVLATEVDGAPIAYADAVDVTPGGLIVFSDASTRHGAKASGDTLEASKLDILEHGGHGRLISHDLRTGTTRVIRTGLDFANGVAIDPTGRFALVCETGTYRVLRVPLSGDGPAEPLVSNLPGFPDNIRRGKDGRYWLGLVSPRRAILDHLSGWPRLRAAVQRLPAFMRPDAVRYGHLVAIDAQGTVLRSLQAPEKYGFVTGAVETDAYLFVTSLKADRLARLPQRAATADPRPDGGG